MIIIKRGGSDGKGNRREKVANSLFPDAFMAAVAGPHEVYQGGASK